MAVVSDERTVPALWGWFDHVLAASHRAAPDVGRNARTGYAVVGGPAFSLRLKSDCGTVHVAERSVTVVLGEPRGVDMRPLTAAEVARIAGDGKAAANRESLRGRFAVVHIDLAQACVTLITDCFAVLPLCWAVEASKLEFSDRADAVGPANQREIDLQAVFSYVYFHVIPAPRTIFRGVQRLPAATRLSFDAGGPRSASTWQPVFEAKQDFNLAIERERFRTLLRQAVEREATTPRIGAFLSGGTDSSTVVGQLGLATGAPVDAFAIGFEASGYDEMSYARLSAGHFNARLHEHYLTPDELVRAIPLVAAHYDQPFGNSSALPAYYCAHLARDHGVEKLLAGDGGDELFGGNTRYARQKVFGLYDAAPDWLRRRAIEPLLLGSSGARNVPGIRKLARYVEQARVPMPARMESYNLLDRFGADAVFTPAFLQRVDRSDPPALQREVYESTAARSIVDRMIAYDWRFTLTDSDLPKVRCTAQLANEMVGFPLLDDDLVDFSVELPASMKVRGLTLRYFFKDALRDFLPEQVIRKKKHGFGLPFGPWLVRDEPLARFASLSLERLAARGFIRRELVHDLFSNRLREHPGFYGEMVWVLMMLEHWLERHASNFRVD
ncbi:MAG: asparagine synthase C-terminal domain-containing protein [Pseudomonadota bacterium]|nr:asparagine synthase C-terminal domain-containing protein [Pseudomonadota bacterium]